MSAAVLFVDDESAVLEGIQRTLRKRFSISTANSGAEALRLLRESGPFGLVVSDMRMPGMSGVEFLSQVRELAPETVRMMLSGQADLQAMIAAVNEGNIYRFISKPCPSEQLTVAIEDGLEQHRLRTAEKVLLEQTLSGAVNMLVEILGMVSPGASSRAARLKHYTLALARALPLPDRWEWGFAAQVSQLGCVSFPGDMLARFEAGQKLSDEETRLFESHPEVAAKLLAAIPRLEDVAAIVSSQFGSESFAGMQADPRLWDVRSGGRLLLRASIEFDRLIVRGAAPAAAAKALQASNLGFPAEALRAAALLKPTVGEVAMRKILLKELSVGMVIDEDLVTPKGILMVSAGHDATSTLIVRLNSMAGSVGIVEPFRVRVRI